MEQRQLMLPCEPVNSMHGFKYTIYNGMDANNACSLT